MIPGQLDSIPVQDAAAVRASRWGTLPVRVRPDQLIEEVPTEPPHDPDGGGDPNRDWMLRYC
jgi:hypothetical protein